jgi:thiamine-phosphate pyrophosphorylase
VLAQGGIDAARVAAILRAGAAGVALTGEVLLADDPGAACARIRRALDGPH